MEIEKKYKIKEIPGNLLSYSQKRIEQGYLCKNPVVRIRKSNEDYILTYKSKFGLGKEEGREAQVSNEVEVPLNQEGYEHLKTKIDGNLIEKVRYLIPLSNGLTAELDVFHGKLEGLVFTEVEFKDEAEAKAFIPPDWFGEDVTFDKRYSNNHLAMVDSFDEMQYNEVW